MSKRTFRTAPASTSAGYPTYDEYDGSTSRRAFLGRLGALGAALLGGGALAACGDRSVGASPDSGLTPDRGLPGADLHVLGGAAPSPDGRLPRPDTAPPPPLAGEAPLPDARIDEPDGQATLGKQPALDARIDGCSTPPTPPTP